MYRVGATEWLELKRLSSAPTSVPASSHQSTKFPTLRLLNLYPARLPLADKSPPPVKSSDSSYNEVIAGSLSHCRYASSVVVTWASSPVPASPPSAIKLFAWTATRSESDHFSKARSRFSSLTLVI